MPSAIIAPMSNPDNPSDFARADQPMAKTQDHAIARIRAKMRLLAMYTARWCLMEEFNCGPSVPYRAYRFSGEFY